MDLLRQIDSYCERLDPGYWAEPVNAVSNLAFLVAAYIMFRRVRGQGIPLAEVLCAILAVIGVGSYLFHTHATVWSSILDVVPIAAFVLVYLFAANLHFWRMPLWAALLGMAAFVPYAMAMTPVFARMTFFDVSAVYWPIPVLITLYSMALRNRTPLTAHGLAIGSAILVVSLTFRSVDEPICRALPIGTHFVWHLFNGLMLGWMIEVYRRHMIATAAASV
jgi:hypothetical protein